MKKARFKSQRLLLIEAKTLAHMTPPIVFTEGFET